MKKIVALVIALALTMGLTGGLVFADDGETSGTCGDNLTWVLEDGVLTISGSGEMYDFDQYSAPWYEYSWDITSVIVEEGVTTIGNYAFEYCGLETAELPETLTAIGKFAFSYCYYLTKITIPDAVTYIGDDAFADCISLSVVELSENLTYIGDWAFYGTAITEVYIPYSVTYIGYAFYDCEYLTDIYYEGSRIEWYAICEGWYSLEADGVEVHCAVDDDAVISSGSCGDNLSYTLTGGGVLTISGTGDMYDYEYDDTEWEPTTPWADYGSYITEVVLEDGITGIGDYAFAYLYDITEIDIPDSVTSIGAYAFTQCYEISQLVIPDSVTELGERAFYYCTGITELTLSSGLTVIPEYAFAFTDMTNIVIPEGVTEICDSAFWHVYSLESVSLPEGLLVIGDDAFAGCEACYTELLSEITIPDTVTTIGSYAFWCQPLTSVTIPESVTSIGYMAFANEGDDEDTNQKYVIFEGDAPGLVSGYYIDDDGSETAYYDIFGFIYGFGSDYSEFYPDVTIYYYSDAEGFTDEYKTLLEEGANVTWVVLERESGEIVSTGEDGTASGTDESSADSSSLSIIDSETTASYTLGSGSGAVIAVDADIDTFVSVTVDGTVLAQDTDYTATEGSTIITFTESFLESLSEGDHEVVITFEDGDVETTLTIKAADTSSDSDDSGSPETGDSSNPAVWMALGLLAAFGLVTASLRRKFD